MHGTMHCTGSSINVLHTRNAAIYKLCTRSRVSLDTQVYSTTLARQLHHSGRPTAGLGTARVVVFAAALAVSADSPLPGWEPRGEDVGCRSDIRPACRGLPPSDGPVLPRASPYSPTEPAAEPATDPTTDPTREGAMEAGRDEEGPPDAGCASRGRRDVVGRVRGST